MTTLAYGPNDLPIFTTALRAAAPAVRGDGTSTALLSNGAAVLLWGTSFNGVSRKATVGQALLLVPITNPVAGSTTISAQLLAAPFDVTTTWQGKPGTTGTVVSQTLSSPPAGTVVTLDVTSLIAGAVAAGSFPGLQLSVTAGADVTVSTAVSATVTFTQQLAAPTGLAPNGAVGVSKPMLSGFPADTKQVRIQIDASPTGFGSPDWQSGTQDVAAPQYDLATSSYPGGGLAVDQWWIASVNNGGGWSDYSDPIKFTFIPLPALAITGPNAQFPYVTDPSPTFTWTFSGQVAYRVYVTLVADGDKTVIWDSGRVESTAHSVTMPNGNLTDRRQYRVWVRCWDGQDRAAVPGAQDYAQSAQVFTFTETAGVPPFNSLLVDQVSTSPVVRVQGFRLAGPPDRILIWRDDVLLDDVDPADIADAGTGGYTYDDYTAEPNVSHTYYMEAVSNGNASTTGPQVSIIPVVAGVWLTDKLRQLMVLIVAESWGLTAEDQATAWQGLGQRNENTRTTALGYLKGTLSGVLCFDPASGRSGRSFRSDLNAMRTSPNDLITVHAGALAFKATVGDVSYGPDPDRSDPDRFAVSMTLKQQDDMTVAVPLPPPTGGVDVTPDKVYDWTDQPDGTAIAVGQADVTASAGSPVRHTSASIHTGVRGWSGGSITRPVTNPNSFTLERYFTVPAAGSLTSSWSIFTGKNPASTPNQPFDVRLRTGGTIDIKWQDGSIADTAGLLWKSFAGKPCRALMRVERNPDLGTNSVDVWLTFDWHIEDALPQTEMHAVLPGDQAVNYGLGSPSVGVAVSSELERVWWTAIQASPYGAPLPQPPLKSLDLRIGGSTGTSMVIAASVWGTDAVPVSSSDLIGLNRATNAAMTTGLTSLTAAVRDANAFRRWVDSGLTAGTTYYYQLTKNGSPVGVVHKAKASAAAGAVATLTRAVGGCQQSPPASSAAFDDIVAWAPDAFIHLGDDTYPDDLDTFTATHCKWYTASMTDPALQSVQQVMRVEKVISDHDDNGGSTPEGNAPTYNDPVTATSLLAWASSVPMLMADTRSPKRGRYTSRVAGNIREIFLDTRSMDRTNQIGGDPNDPAATMLGATQLSWLHGEFVAAAAAHQLSVIYTDPSFRGTIVEGDGMTGGRIDVSYSDKWPAYAYERAVIITDAQATLRKTAGSPNLIVIASDSHACQQDDGALTGDGIACFVCGPLHQNIHAHFVDSYQVGGVPRTYPANAADSGRLPSKMMYQRFTFAEAPAGTVTLTVTARNCTPKDPGAPYSIWPDYVRSYTL